ncbi:vacuolar protein sorting-associated protein 33A-like isoform X2 [Ctenocephalides felis]|uniref:vacuolar protein sorting-associated protein 33A-like isoform X2 n=1 Tax=Ctenocephalides felis TaxID=7515 RepID=UPI000E6E5B7E|nr:vacuolar protein sorting-associated protein 33A-like isoform X2 [Ctenocephalides felis]
MSSYLSGGRLNIAYLQETYRNELLSLLDACDGKKVIIWDESLAGPVGLVAKYSMLRDVEKMYHLRKDVFPNISDRQVRHVIFITRPNEEMMDIIAMNILKNDRENLNGSLLREFHLFFVPRKSILCIERLKNKGVYGSLTNVFEFKCHLFPLDNDLVSMELPCSFRELYLENDPTCIHQSALALMSLQRMFGQFNKICGKGQYANQLMTHLKRMTKLEEFSQTKSSIDQLLIIERSTDLISPLITQLTYEGLIDEFYGISNNTASFPAQKFHSDQNDNSAQNLNVDTKLIVLNSADELFSELRDKNFNAVGSALSKQARSIASQFEERHKDKSVQEIKQFVAKLPDMLASKQALATHTAIAEYIKEETDSFNFMDTLQCEQEFLSCIDTEKPNPYVEDLIAQSKKLIKVLRLLCLQSLTGSGLKQKVLEYYKRELVHVYGINTFLTLNNLEKCGLLRMQTGSRQYAVLRKTLRLTMQDTSELTPTDISYVHSIYAPLSIRLVEHIVRNKNWLSLQDTIGVLPGPLFEEQISSVPSQVRRESIQSENSQSDSSRVILVFFLGGCTYAEISALRFLSQQEENNVEFVIATTKIINGNNLIESLMQPLPE